MGRLTASAAVLVLAVGVAACGGSSKVLSASSTSTADVTTTTEETATTATPAPPDTSTLSNQLLGVGDLPAGWTTSPSSSGGSNPIVGCTVPSFKQNEAARAEADFQGNTTGVPAVEETLASFSGDLAKTGFNSGSDDLNACHTFTLSADGTTYHGTAQGISLGMSFGDESAAWQLGINATGFSAVIDEVAVQIGDEDMIFAYTATSAPGIAAINSLVGVAVDKVTGTAPPATTSTTTVPATTATTAAAPTTTAVPPTAAAPTTVTVAVNYGQQFLTDEAPWDTAITAARDTGFYSPQLQAAGQAAVVTARLLLTSTWPAADEGDIHTLAANFDVINEDIELHDLAKYDSDGTDLNAAANVVRAELDLPPIR